MHVGSVNKFGINKQIFIAFFVVLSIILYFSYHTISGNKGIFRYFELSKELKEKSFIKGALSIKKKDKQNLVNAMDLKSLDIDLLDEQARKNLGHAGKREVVIYEK